MARRYSVRAPEHIARGGLALPLRHHPVFDAHAFAAVCVGVACDVTGGVYPGNAGFEIFIDQHAVVDSETGLLCKLHRRSDADADHHQIGGYVLALFRRDRICGDRCRFGLEMKDDAVRSLVQVSDEVADLRSQDALQWSRIGRDTCTSSPRARNDAAASSPMKLAPITTACLAFAVAAMMRTTVRTDCAGNGRAADPRRVS